MEEQLIQIIKTDSVVEFNKVAKQEQLDDFVFQCGKNVLHYAVEHQAKNILESYLQGEININFTDKLGQTALFYAVEDASITDLLVNAGADVKAIGNHGQTVAHVACSAGQETVIRKLITAGADFKTKDDKMRNSMHYAATEANLNIMVLLTDLHVDTDLHTKDSLGKTPIDSLVDKLGMKLLHESNESLVQRLTSFHRLLQLVDPVVIHHSNKASEKEFLEYTSAKVRRTVENYLMNDKAVTLQKLEEAVWEDICEKGSARYLQAAMELEFISKDALERRLNNVQAHESPDKIQEPDEIDEKIHNNDTKYETTFSLLIREEKYDLVKELLLLRQTELIPSSLQVIITCQKTMETRDPNKFNLQNVIDLLEYAKTVLLNAIDCLYNTGNAEYRDLLLQYIEGDFFGGSNSNTEKRPTCSYKYGTQFVYPNAKSGALKLKSVVKLIEAANVREVHATECFADYTDRKWRGESLCMCKRKVQVSPRAKCIFHAIAFAVFLILLGATILTTENSVTWKDWIVAVYAVSYLIQEFYELVIHGVRFYSRNIWNLFDWFATVMVLVGVALKIVQYESASAERKYDIHICLATGFLLYGFKGVALLRTHQKLGPIINMMKTLFWEDLIPFLISFYVLLVICSGVFFHSLLTPRNYNFYSNGSEMVSSREELYNIYIRPLFLSFGELQLDDHKNCIDGENLENCYHKYGNLLYVRGFLQIYLIIVNLLLMNLLIAKFSLTVANKDDMSHVIWRKYRYDSYKEFRRLNILPPPINIPELLIRFVAAIRRNRKHRQEKHSTYAMDNMHGQSTREGEVTQESYQKFLLFQALSFRGVRREFLTKTCKVGNGFDKLTAEIQNLKPMEPRLQTHRS